MAGLAAARAQASALTDALEMVAQVRLLVVAVLKVRQSGAVASSGPSSVSSSMGDADSSASSAPALIDDFGASLVAARTAIGVSGGGDGAMAAPAPLAEEHSRSLVAALGALSERLFGGGEGEGGGGLLAGLVPESVLAPVATALEKGLLLEGGATAGTEMTTKKPHDENKEEHLAPHFTQTVEASLITVQSFLKSHGVSQAASKKKMKKKDDAKGEDEASAVPELIESCRDAVAQAAAVSSCRRVTEAICGSSSSIAQ